MATRPSPIHLSLVVGRNHQDVSDADLARGLIAGEAWAVAGTWHRFAPMVLKLAERSLGSKTEAEDLSQEVFYRLFKKASLLRDPNTLRSFIYSFAIRALKSQLRSRKVRGWLSFHQPEDLLDLAHDTLDVESRDLLRRFHVLLDRLRPRDRLVFTLRQMESMTVEEIAAAMDISISTVKRSMARATQRLCTWIDADPGLAGLIDARRWKR